MTLPNLSKILDKYEQQLEYSSGSIQQFELLKGLPFYDWLDLDSQATAKTTAPYNNNARELSLSFNHVIGLPQKDGRTYPLFDYEQILYDTLQQHKHVWIKKATGLGVTEFMLRYMAWLCFNGGVQTNPLSPVISGSQMCVVTGPRIELAITLIDRMKGLFGKLIPIGFDTKEIVRSIR